jgi:hypothetical protein
LLRETYSKRYWEKAGGILDFFLSSYFGGGFEKKGKQCHPEIKYPSTRREAKIIVAVHPVPTVVFPGVGNTGSIGVKASTGSIKRANERSRLRYNGIYAGVLRVTERFPIFRKGCCRIAVFIWMVF